MGVIDAIKAKLAARMPDGKADASDMKRINTYTAKPIEPASVFVFPAVMATGQMTDYFTHLLPSSLRNFSSDADKGVPFNMMHERLFRSYGFTYAGFNDTENQEARSAVYIPRGRRIAQDAPDSNHIIADIEQGLLREVSVAFGGPARFVCDVCGKDLFSLDCPHLPGMPADGGSRATAGIEDARLEHLAGADRGACPGAIIGSVNPDSGIPLTYSSLGMDFCTPLRDKCATLQRSSRVSKEDSSSFLDLWKQTNPLITHSTPTVREAQQAAATTPPEGGQGGDRMDRNKLAAALTQRGLTAFGVALMAANVTDEPESIGAALTAAYQTAMAERPSDNPLVTALTAAEIKTPQALSSVLEEAKQGREYRAGIITEAEKEAVRALGVEGAKGLGEALKGMPSSVIASMRDQWKKMGDAQVGITGDAQTSTRQTAPMSLPRTAVAEVDDATKKAREEDGKQLDARIKRLGPTAAGKNGG